jgi:hypothetical protein
MDSNGEYHFLKCSIYVYFFTLLIIGSRYKSAIADKTQFWEATITNNSPTDFQPYLPSP